MAEAYLVQPGGGGKPIKKAVVTLSTSSYTYNNSQHAPTVQSVMLGDVALVANQDYVPYVVPQTNAGDYKAIVFGINKYSGVAEADWKINKAAGSISAQPGSVSIQGMAGTTAAVTLTIVGDGAVRVGESELVSGSVEGTKLTLTSVSEGTGTVQIILDEGQNYTGASCEVSVSVMFASRILNENSWDTIAGVSAAGKASQMWMVGDEKPAFYWRTVRIIGFDHDDLASSDEKHDDPSYNGGNNKAGITFQFTELVGSERINYPEDNSCGWLHSEMRNKKMPEYAAKCTDAAPVMRTVTKLTARSKDDSTISKTADKMYLLSEAEFVSSIKESHNGEGTQYRYYRNGGSIIMYYDDREMYHWTRSPSSLSRDSFVAITSTGEVVSVGTTVVHYIAPAFSV